MLSVFGHASAADLVQIQIVIAALVLLLIYIAIGYGPLRRLYAVSEPISTKQLVSFTGGCIVMYLSFGGPLDYLSDQYLFSAHMVQHMAEVLFMAPLLIYGTPGWMVRPLMDVKGLAIVLRAWSNPITSSIVFNVVLDGFHLPALYDLALNSDSFHFFEHICFFVVSVFLWLSRRPLSPGKQLLFLLLNYNLMMPLVILMIVAHHPWYTYYVHQPRLYAWLTPMADQQAGAIVMAVMMAGVYAWLGVRAYSKQDESIWYD